MKLIQAEKKFETNADFDSQDFTIGDVSVVIEILRNKLYRHKVRTLVQEYVSNARDAMREVNNTKDRIEVTFPTVFAPTFKVRDFGPGINPDRMYNVFIKYAASTKRSDNKQTGGFGIGAKSAWSYTDSFTIVTYVDGVQRTYIAHIGANNNGRLDFLGECSTSEKNGTEIQIPVSPKDVKQFTDAILRATYFWSDVERPKFLNAPIEYPVYIQGDVTKNIEVNNNLPEFICTKWENGIVIAIDGIPYFINRDFFDKVKGLDKLTELVPGKIILHLKTGELEVSASREEIADSKYTITNLEATVKTVINEIHIKLSNEFAKAKTAFDYLKVYTDLYGSYNLFKYSKFSHFSMTRNGIQSEHFSSVKMEHCSISKNKGDLVKTRLDISRRNYRIPVLKPELFNHLYYIDGIENVITTNHRIRTLLKSVSEIIVISKQDTDKGEFNLLKKDLGLKDLKTVPFVKPIRKTKDIIKVERTKQEFHLLRLDRLYNQGMNTSLESNKDKWLYLKKDDAYSKYDLLELSSFLSKKGYKLCALSNTTINKVKNDSNFISLESYLKNYKLSKQDIINIKFECATHVNTMKYLNKLDGIKDKYLIDMISEYDFILKNFTEKVPSIIKNLFPKIDEIEQFKTNDKMLDTKFKTKYPLLDCIDKYNTKLYNEVVHYINSK